MSRSFEDVAAELLRLPPGEFTARRNALAKELRGDDRALADPVAQLPKPSLAAWAVDVFAHERQDELAELLDLGAALRDAQRELSRERMQALTGEAHELVRKVVADVAAVASDSGSALSDAARAQVEQTLRAAMADPDASDAVRAGLLAKPLETGVSGPSTSAAQLPASRSTSPRGRARRPRRETRSRTRRPSRLAVRCARRRASSATRTRSCPAPTRPSPRPRRRSQRPTPA